MNEGNVEILHNSYRIVLCYTTDLNHVCITGKEKKESDLMGDKRWNNRYRWVKMNHSESELPYEKKEYNIQAKDKVVKERGERRIKEYSIDYQVTSDERRVKFPKK